MTGRPGPARLVAALAVLTAGSVVTGTAVAAGSAFTQAPPPVVRADGAVLVVDLPAGVAPTRCTLDGAVVEQPACSRRGLVVNGLAEGPHTAGIQVPGEAGPRTASWRVDATAPTLRVTRAPRAWVRSTTPVVRYSASDNTDRVANLRFWCSHQASGCAAGEAELRLRREGRHAWTVHVSDRAGNIAARYGTVGVDLRPPATRPRHARYTVTHASTSPLRWNLRDSASGVASVDARLRTAGRVGTWSPWRYPASRQDTGRAPQTLQTPRRGRTVCLQVRAEDRVGRRSDWARAVCRAGLVDVADVDQSPGWGSRTRDRTWQARSAHVTTRRGARLTAPAGRGVADVGLRVLTGPGQGRVQVGVGAHVVARLDLDRRRRRLRTFSLAVPPGARGPLRVTVTSAGRPVWVDGVGLARRLANG
jgi:hypothetical protein